MWHVSRQVLKKQSISDICYGPQTEKAHLETGSFFVRQTTADLDVIDSSWRRWESLVQKVTRSLRYTERKGAWWKMLWIVVATLMRYSEFNWCIANRVNVVGRGDGIVDWGREWAGRLHSGAIWENCATLYIASRKNVKEGLCSELERLLLRKHAKRQRDGQTNRQSDSERQTEAEYKMHDCGLARDGTGSRVTGSLGHRVSDFDRVGSGHGSVCQIGV